jgi:hypothetical protein
MPLYNTFLSNLLNVLVQNGIKKISNKHFKNPMRKREKSTGMQVIGLNRVLLLRVNSKHVAIYTFTTAIGHKDRGPVVACQ